MAVVIERLLQEEKKQTYTEAKSEMEALATGEQRGTNVTVSAQGRDCRELRGREIEVTPGMTKEETIARHEETDREGNMEQWLETNRVRKE